MNPILLVVWAVLAAGFLGLLLYRGQLTRYEESQMFLSDETNRNEKEMQSAIVRKVERLQPIVRILGGAAGLVTAGVVGLYVWNAWLTIR